MLVFLLFTKESESDYMLTIETKELNISEELRKKVDMICKFAYVKPTYKNGNIRNIKGTNIADNVVEEITSYHGLGYYSDRDLHDIAADTPREEEINNYIYEQYYGIDKDYDERDIDI